jgi:hypothetical protein
MGSSNARFQPVALRGAMRALLRDVRNVHHHLFGAVHVEYLAAGTLPVSQRLNNGTPTT